MRKLLPTNSLKVQLKRAIMCASRGELGGDEEGRRRPVEARWGPPPVVPPG